MFEQYLKIDRVLEHAERRLSRLGAETEWLHVCNLPAEDLVEARFDSPAIRQAVASVERADGVIVGSPVYKAAYTGLLKSFLDLLPQKGLEGKITAPVFIGGSIAHLLAIEYALKPYYRLWVLIINWPVCLRLKIRWFEAKTASELSIMN